VAKVKERRIVLANCNNILIFLSLGDEKQESRNKSPQVEVRCLLGLEMA
jgi:hypothetical protein